MKRSEKKERTKEILVQAAREVFSANGYHKVNVQDIVEKASIAHGTFYLYFKSKKQLFVHLINLLLDELYSSLSSIPVSEINTYKDYEAQLRILTRRGAEVFLKNIDLTRILLWEAVGLDEELNKIITDLLDQFSILGQFYIEHGKSLGFMRDDMNPATGSRIVVATVWGIVFRWAAGNIKFETALKDIEELISELLYGVIKPSIRDNNKKNNETN